MSLPPVLWYRFVFVVCNAIVNAIDSCVLTMIERRAKNVRLNNSVWSLLFIFRLLSLLRFLPSFNECVRWQKKGMFLVENHRPWLHTKLQRQEKRFILAYWALVMSSDDVSKRQNSALGTMDVTPTLYLLCFVPSKRVSTDRSRKFIAFVLVSGSQTLFVYHAETMITLRNEWLV